MYQALLKQRLTYLFTHRFFTGKERLFYFASSFEHITNGNHVLSGVRTTSSSLIDWFGRWDYLFSNHNVEIDSVMISGMPWHSCATIEWTIDAGINQAGEGRRLEGVHVLVLRWGKIVSLHTYFDTQQFINVLCSMGQDKANLLLLNPITDYYFVRS